jgi:uncharacterized membrane protein HdeD (DUF308 family)
MDVLLSRNWWAVAIRGLAALIFGILALIWPRETFLVLVILFGAYALVDGIFAVVSAIRGRTALRDWGWLLAEGIIGIVIGVITFFSVSTTALVLLYLIAFWAILTGIAEVVQAVQLRRVISNEWMLILGGAASVIFGLLLVIFPGTGALAVTWLIGLYAIIFGILLLVLAWRLRGMQQNMPSGTAVPV